MPFLQTLQISKGVGDSTRPDSIFALPRPEGAKSFSSPRSRYEVYCSFCGLKTLLHRRFTTLYLWYINICMYICIYTNILLTTSCESPPSMKRVHCWTPIYFTCFWSPMVLYSIPCENDRTGWYHLFWNLGKIISSWTKLWFVEDHPFIFEGHNLAFECTFSGSWDSPSFAEAPKTEDHFGIPSNEHGWRKTNMIWSCLRNSNFTQSWNHHNVHRIHHKLTRIYQFFSYICLVYF